jgi:hypothetical protein
VARFFQARPAATTSIATSPPSTSLFGFRFMIQVYRLVACRAAE